MVFTARKLLCRFKMAGNGLGLNEVKFADYEM